MTYNVFGGTLNLTQSINQSFRTFTAAGKDELEDMSLVGALQSVEKRKINDTGMVHDNVQQFFGRLDRLAAFRHNGLQLFQRESVTLKHVACDALCV